jgi:hypothetical protein
MERAFIRFPVLATEKFIMPVTLLDQTADNIVEVHATGKLSKEDYQHFAPALEQVIAARGKIRLLFEMTDFHGWEMGALWEDIKFDAKHFRDIERLAIIGESQWEKGMATFCKPFTSATVKYFDHAQAAEARRWIREA